MLLLLSLLLSSTNCTSPSPGPAQKGFPAPESPLDSCHHDDKFGHAAYQDHRARFVPVLGCKVGDIEIVGPDGVLCFLPLSRFLSLSRENSRGDGGFPRAGTVMDPESCACNDAEARLEQMVVINLVELSLRPKEGG